jgi:hypothetical protein
MSQGPHTPDELSLRRAKSLRMAIGLGVLALGIFIAFISRAVLTANG